MSDSILVRHSAATGFRVTLVAVSAGTAGLLAGYGTSIINGALVSLRAEFSLDALQTELVTTILLWGCALGAALAGFLSDRYGRRAPIAAWCRSGTRACSPRRPGGSAAWRSRRAFSRRPMISRPR